MAKQAVKIRMNGAKIFFIISLSRASLFPGKIEVTEPSKDGSPQIAISGYAISVPIDEIS
jgi:hypothetical protein